MKKNQKIKTVHMGVHRKLVKALWAVLIFSTAFGIYKNFTAIDRHTVHEQKIIERRVTDTNKIESFVRNFARVYYTWNDQILEQRKEQLKQYLTHELQVLNEEMLGEHIAAASAFTDLQFWDVEQVDDHIYAVRYAVTQMITPVMAEEEQKETVTSVYELQVYADEQSNMIIVKNPTVSNIPGKSSYEPKQADSDGRVDGATMEEVNAFLETFFTLYPAASEKELAYYVKGGALMPIDGDYTFLELHNPVYRMEGKTVKADVAVKYLDQRTKAVQISQFELRLEKGDNWMIVG